MMRIGNRPHLGESFRSCAHLGGIFLILAASAFGAAADHGYDKARGGPGDAAVFINGKYVGPAARYTVPEKYEAPLGEVEVAIRDPRCEDFVTKVTVQPGKTVHLHYKLKERELEKPPFGTFRLKGQTEEWTLSSDDAGAVYINDKYFGYVAELKKRASGILLNPGSYELHIQSPDFGDIRQKFNIVADKTTVIQLPTAAAQ
jgi:hypothetical protein